MNVYKYDELTKEYTGVETAQLDPLESKAQGKEVFIIPGNATDKEPPQKEGFAAVYVGGVWELQEDNRGKEYWLPGDEYGTPARTMKELGPFPEGAVFEAPEKTLKQLKAEKVAGFKAQRNAEEIAPVEWNGNLYDYDADSRDRLSIARQALEDMGQAAIVWTTAENTRVEIGVADFKGINGAAAYRSNLLHVKYNQLKAQVEAVETKEQLAAIEW